MNEFVAKKLGEVDAFIRLVINTYEQGKPGFEKVLTSDEIQQTLVALSSLQSAIENMAEAAGQATVTLEKSAKTYAKISKARDDYVAERWDDTVELYEWFSFNSGAGSAHAHEVYGAALAINDVELSSVMEQARDYFDDLLITCKDYLYEVGSAKATD